MHLAIDYGSKLAGTTALCWAASDCLRLAQSEKKQDADVFLKKQIAELRPAAVFIDAPLSLPGVYTGQGHDYFYRACDRAVAAMSPMFLGGLTARAMRLRAGFPDLPFFEIYPGYLARTVLPQAEFYKKENLEGFCELLAEHLPLPFAELPKNWHQVDAALAWLSGWRYGSGEALVFGEEPEGLIVV